MFYLYLWVFVFIGLIQSVVVSILVFLALIGSIVDIYMEAYNKEIKKIAEVNGEDKPIQGEFFNAQN